MKKGLAIGIIALLFVTSVTPVVFGYNQQVAVKSEMDILLEQLAFDCKDRIGGDAKFEYYKEKLLGEDAGFDVVDDQYTTIGVDRYYTTSLQDPIEPLLSNGGLMNSSWPMKSHDVRHTGLSPYSTEDVDGLEKWRFYADDWLDASPVIDSDGVIYFQTKGGGLYAVYPDGTLKWNFEDPGWTWSTPAIAEDGTIYVASYDDFLYAVNPDGTEKWRFGSGSSISSSPAIADDGTIYFGTMWSGGNGGKIFAINPDGTEKWRYDTGYFVECDPVIGDDGTIYIGSGDTYFYAMNPNGTLKWRFKTGDEIHGHPAIGDDGTIYISSWDDYLYALNPDGSIKWISDVDYGLSNGVAIGDDGTIYVGRLKLHALDPDDGSVIWSTELGDEYWIGESSPAISADGIIYVGAKNGIPESDGGGILAFNPDGTIKWYKEISVNRWVESSPCIAEDGTVYIGSAYYQSRGFLHAFGPVTSNDPPETPSISGETHGEVGEEYWYQFLTVDPDNNPISFYIDWGDGEEGWSIEWGSGEDVGFAHTWSEEGNYTIRAKARDVLGLESDWGYLDVTMPVNQQYNYPFLELFQERFPILYELMVRLLGGLRL